MGAKRRILPNIAQGFSWLVSVMPRMKLHLDRLVVPFRSLIPRKPSTPSSTTITIGRPLPQDLYRMILAFLVADFQEAQASIVHDHSTLRNKSSAEEDEDYKRRRGVITNARLPIYSLALVSRWWNGASIPFLYAQPFLFDIDRVDSFQKTLSTRGSDLAAFVKHPVVIIPCPDSVTFGLGSFKVEGAIINIFKIQRACVKLSSLTIEIQSRSQFLKPPKTLSGPFLEHAGGARLENFRIIGFVKPGIPAHFGILGTLCLNSVTMVCPGPGVKPPPLSVELPTLPAVHTVHLVHCSIRSVRRPRRTVFTLAKFPRLRNLTLENNEIQQDILHDILLEFELDRLLLFGSNEIDFLKEVLLRGGEPDGQGHVKATLHSVKHLTLKHDPQNHRVCTKLLEAKMRKLETLTYFVDTEEVSLFSTRMVSSLKRAKVTILTQKDLLRQVEFVLGRVPGPNGVEDEEGCQQAMQKMAPVFKELDLEFKWRMMRLAEWCTHACF